MSKRERENEFYEEQVERSREESSLSVEDYDKKLEGMKEQIKLLKKIKRRQKKLKELEEEQSLILKKMKKREKSKHK
ncbi:hypothetical protein [Clostridium sp. UBA4548]|uniref:hypothetical protein n=1 Tax=Clostridium sp. UBA4548 TaxID=1946361 RepID=UPI0025C3FC86|nr:hypothetical protein [Clostridium sp. UBA4548]